jgi:spore maturation protein CgeB/glycosyltransferase involved in cell wall biosynthesis
MPDRHDQIMDAYNGKMGEAFMKKVHARINWICSHVAGREIFDVGCSQGIVPILLAREGCSVVGLDIDENAINQANEFLKEESKTTQDAVTFVCDDFLRMDTSGFSVDTVILTEILEHCVRPSLFVEKAVAMLNQDGKMIVTVPFGVNDFIDHKHTFYLKEPYDLVCQYFEDVQFTFIDEWLGLNCSGLRPSKVEVELEPSDVLFKLEEAFYNLELPIREAFKERSAALDNANMKYRELTREQIPALKQRILDQENRAASLASERDRSKVELQSVNAELQVKANEIEEVRRELQTKASELQERDVEIQAKDSELLAQAGEIQVLKSELQSKDADLRTKDSELQARDAELRGKDSELQAVNAELRDLGAAFKVKDAEFQVKKAELQAKVLELQARESDVQALDAELQRRLAINRELEVAAKHRQFDLDQLHATENRLSLQVQKEAENVARLQEQLNVANQKYRDATRDIIPALKQKLSAANGGIAEWNEDKLKLKQNLYDLKIQNTKLKNQVGLLRSSVSFQLGNALVNTVCTWNGIFKLPFALLSIIGRGGQMVLRKFRKQSSPVVSEVPSMNPPKIEEDTNQLVGEMPRPLGGREDAEALMGTGSSRELRVACIMDEFTFHSYEPECDLHQLTPDGWRTELEDIQPEMLFIESAWRGKDELWGSKVGHCSHEVSQIVEWCRNKKIPTVFWNKEDPVHFQTFLNTAKLFDYVFTTDFDCIHRYKSALGHERVYLLPFACQPKSNNPIELYERKDAVSFAGAYYVRYPDRTADLNSFLSALPTVKPVEIFDRNYGKDDPNYQFPDEYNKYIVGTLPFEKIDMAYKGYKYAINLNSIKKSQTMFARRVFELLASNTITVSNFSRGIRLLFGDLVVTSDDGSQIVSRLDSLTQEPETEEKFRLAALRKVMMEHTYAQRLEYICSKVEGLDASSATTDDVAVVAYAATPSELDHVLNSFNTQSHKKSTLVLVVPDQSLKFVQERVKVFTTAEVAKKTLKEMTGDAYWCAFMFAADYYGPNYLLDIVVATKYSSADGIGKASYYAVRDNSVVQSGENQAYRSTSNIDIRCGAVKMTAIAGDPATKWVDNIASGTFDSGNALSIDHYNYCRNGADFDLEVVSQKVDDLEGLDTGNSIFDVQQLAENLPASCGCQEEAKLDDARLAEVFHGCKGKSVELAQEQDGLRFRSSLEEGKHEYLYATQDLKAAEVANDNELKCYLDSTPGLAISLVFLYLDADKNRISHDIFPSNHNNTATLPEATQWVRLGFRILSAGECKISCLSLTHRYLQPPVIMGKAKYLVLTNIYPSYESLYQNAFVHSRVKAYAEQGVSVDVFCLRKDQMLSYYEFEDIDVITGDSGALENLLSSGQYESVLVHFLNPEMWFALEKYIDKLKVIVWVHGAEIYAWHRRAYNYTTEAEVELAKIQSEKRQCFWKSVLQEMPANLTLVFVSQIFADEALGDLGVDLPKDKYVIIHNPIDVNGFAYEEKTAEKRKKILSIRPYASRQYANDVAVQVILGLSQKPCFADLHFTLIGDGKLFDETVAPVTQFSNVTIQKCFLTHDEIKNYHKMNGIFLCPTRWDSQGVSRDEAMSSGLVPVTNDIAAIPEFVDDTCGVLAPYENVEVMVDGIVNLVENEEFFQTLSKNAASRVKATRSAEDVISSEVQLFAM